VLIQVIAMKQRTPIRNNAPSPSPALQRAVQLHQQGNFDQAERLHKTILAAQPTNFEALRRQGVLQYQRGRYGEALQSMSAALRAAPTHAAAWSDLGVIYAAIGRLQEAVACYDQALALDPNQADALLNRGNALVALNRRQDALASYERAIALKPGFVEALNNRGGLLQELERPAEALETLDKALAIKPNYADALNNRGNALIDLGRDREALESYDKALAVNPPAANALNNRGNALIKLGRPSEALTSYEKALAQNPRDADAWSNRGQALRELGRYGEAIESLKAAILLAPNHAKAHANLGNAFLDVKRPADGLTHYDRAIALKPDCAEALCNRAAALLKLARSQEALASCQAALAIKPDYAEAFCNQGVAIAKLNRDEESLASYDKAIAFKPDYSLAHENKGVALLRLGRLEEATIALDDAIKRDPKSARSYFHFALSTRLERGDPRFEAIEELARETSSLDAEERAYAHFALGKAYADVEDYERSFRHLSAGAALKRQLCAYDEAVVLGDLQRRRLACSAELIERHRGCGDPSEVPVFVIGMPRSGTTLVEQILASHREVHGAGEISDFDLAASALGGAADRALRNPEAVRQMSGEQFRQLGASYLQRIRVAAPAASRIVNKMPENFRFADMIALALPNARIVHVRRDPVDTCFSCFSTLFAENQPYTYDLAELGRYYRAYEALMDVWRRVAPQGMTLEVRYEDVVADLEGQARRILAHCGLEWDARCLEFHRNARSVRTASVAQVRRPLYNSSVGRWRRYEAFLGPLLAALGPSIPSADRVRTPIGRPASLAFAA
jgi:tetratricopeptide (TPR) repeat protein